SSKDIREGAERLAAAALERLELFDVPEHQLEALKRDRKIVKNLHIHSPFKGVVISIGVREGQYVTPKTELYTIADLTRIWAYVDIYEDEMSWVQKGDAAKMTVAGIPGRTFRGKVTYIYPYLDPKTRTNKIRLEFDNPDLTLKPEMFANVTLKTSRQVNAIVIPSEAIVRTGAKDQIFIVKGEGRFEPREVELGVATGGDVQVLKGVSAGERVVTSAQFLIDSESKLNEATAKMMEPSKEEPAPDPDMDMGGMKMDGMKMEQGK
ncbi:Probable Co/Zn/Cd efflux system membrane fusion protein, partial [hydrothermal vent metagenome]